jgi:hypothetical protein
LGFAIWCQEPLIGFCHNFTCGGQCDGDLAEIGFPEKTFPPTQAPTKSGGMASGGIRRSRIGAGMTDESIPAMMIGYYLVFKMMMH